jgi:hypothetical protein
MVREMAKNKTANSDKTAVGLAELAENNKAF